MACWQSGVPGDGGEHAVDVRVDVRVDRGQPSARRSGVGHPASGEGVSGIRIPTGAAEIGDLLLEVFYGGERAIDAREAEVRHLVQLAQWTEDGEPDLVAGDLGGTPGPDGLLHAVGELGERVLVDRPALAGAPHAAHDLLTAERLGDAAALDDREDGFLDHGEPTPAGGAGAATAGGLPVVDLSGVDHAAVRVPTERTSHSNAPPPRAGGANPTGSRTTRV